MLNNLRKEKSSHDIEMDGSGLSNKQSIMSNHTPSDKEKLRARIEAIEKKKDDAK